jgi:NADPH-dependent 2,4-dienoyl-CoA reductase/sulfur reductase-like enzyme
MSNPSFVVVGGGLAAGKAVEELREAGFDGDIVLFSSEPHRPYERPPLSKGYLMGNDPLDSAFLQPPEWYDDQRVDLRLGTTVTGIDRDAHEVVTDTGRQHYDKLLLATGSSPRHLAMADHSGAPVAYLRTIEDSQRLKQAFADHRRLVVIGGGWIGLEVAAAAREAGCEVTVLETLDLPLLRVLGPEVAQVFADLHREHGVDLRTGIQITTIDGDDRHVVVRLADGSTAEGDLLLVGIGVGANDGLARAAGLETDNGVRVDATLASSDPDVFAAGDLANADHPTLGRRLRVEHWDNAIEQGKVAARNMLGQGVPYDRMPYFYTDQYDLGCEYIGNVGPDGYDEVVLRGDVDKRVFTAFWLQGGQVLAGMQVNDWDATDAVRALVGRTVDPARLRDENVPLTEV